MNITSIPTLHPCTGCGGCAAVCPKEAITMAFDEQGFYKPILNPSKCIDCSICTQVCYKYSNIETYDLNSHKEVQLLACQAKDENILKSTTSGGVSYLLAKALFNKGYQCIGSVYDTIINQAKHICASTETDINSFKGSKYIQSMTFPAFKEMLDKKGQKNVLFGTPCQIYAIGKYLEKKKRRKDFLLVDLYCHGCPSSQIWQKYIQEIKELIGKPKFDNIEFRSKIKGWGNFYIIVIVINGIQAFISNRKKDEFYQLFFSNLMLNDACRDCALRSSLEYTDIRLGDFWGRCYDTETRGMSGVTLVTEEGKKAFEIIKNEVTIHKHDFSDFLPYQSWGITYQVNEKTRHHLFEMLKTGRPLKEMQKYYFSQQPFKQKIKRHLKDITYLLPPQYINKVKKLYHQI